MAGSSSIVVHAQNFHAPRVKLTLFGDGRVRAQRSDNFAASAQNRSDIHNPGQNGLGTGSFRLPLPNEREFEN